MKKKYLSVLICSLLISYANTSLASNLISIEKVVVGPQGKDPKEKFSLTIDFINHGKEIHNWQFGFYMPRSFRTTSVSNTKLAMSICEAAHSKTCIPLQYNKPAFTESDLSTVFTTILSPKEEFPLQHNKRYIIHLTHNSSHGSQNYSSLPQSFFLINNDNGKAINIPTNPKTYIITNYDSQKTNQKVSAHILEEWESSNFTTSSLNIVPTPQIIQLNTESSYFDLNDNLTIHNKSKISDNELILWQSALQEDFNQNVKIDTKSSTTGIMLEQVSDNEMPNLEGYKIIISKNQLLIQSPSHAGFFYALQTLRQMWNQSTNLPTMTIIDYPRFKYRGILLDVARHYFSVDEIKNFIDVMSASKLNTLHLHLSDDEAFRLQIPDYPSLTAIGSERGLGKPIGPMGMIQKNLSKAENSYDINNTHKGSYSSDDIKTIIQYANLHQITVIPEIDIPGHSRALMKSLPNTFYESEDKSEYSGYGDNSLPICAYGESSEFGKNFTNSLDNIINYTSHLFNQQTTVYAIPYELGIGGDEVANKTWDKSPLCNNSPWNTMSSLQKEHYFLDMLNNGTKIKHIPLSGWHEFVLNHDGTIDNNGIKPNEIGHVWVWGTYKDSKSKAITLANNNYPTVLSYSDNVYFDMTYNAKFNEPGFYWATHYGDTYAALNVATKASSTQDKSTQPQNIIGIEAGLWGDVIPDYKHLQYMYIPKIAGLSEASWSSESITVESGLPNWQSLAIRLGCGKSGFLNYLNQTYKVRYRGYPNGIALEAPQSCN